MNAARCWNRPSRQIEKQYGKGSIMRLGSRDVLVPVSVIPTGSISLDAALGVGGFPRGRVIEIFGPESGGKTTMALHVIAQAQKARRTGGVHRRRARARSELFAQAGRGRGQFAGFAARQRRAGAGDHRGADSLGRRGCGGGGLGGGVGAARGTRRRNGRSADGLAGAADVASAAQADRRSFRSRAPA